MQNDTISSPQLLSDINKSSETQMAEFFLTPENFSQSLFHCDKQFLRVNSHRILKDVLEFNEGELGVFCAKNQIFLL